MFRILTPCKCDDGLPAAQSVNAIPYVVMDGFVMLLLHRMLVCDLSMWLHLDRGQVLIGHILRQAGGESDRFSGALGVGPPKPVSIQVRAERWRDVSADKDLHFVVTRDE